MYEMTKQQQEEIKSVLIPNTWYDDIHFMRVENNK